MFVDVTGLLLFNAGTQSSTLLRSRNPSINLEADAEVPRRGNHAAIWGRLAARFSVYNSRLDGLQVPVAMLLAISTGSNDTSYLHSVPDSASICLS